MTCACTLATMAVAIQIKDVPEEVRDAVARRAESEGKSTQAYLRSLLEREFRAERNRRILESLVGYRSLTMDADEVVAHMRG